VFGRDRAGYANGLLLYKRPFLAQFDDERVWFECHVILYVAPDQICDL
jgi:hypothetical protein